MSAGRKNNSQIKNWNTPPKIIAAAKDFWNGEIELDPCSNEFSMVGAKRNFLWPQDGLLEDWNAASVFCNPPYGRDSERKTSLLDWAKKSIAANKVFGAEIILLIPVATNTRHFKELFNYGGAICFLADTRLKFWMEGREDKKGAPMACCLVYIGERVEEFIRVFSGMGKCVVI